MLREVNAEDPLVVDPEPTNQPALPPSLDVDVGHSLPSPPLDLRLQLVLTGVLVEPLDPGLAPLQRGQRYLPQVGRVLFHMALLP
jgi:hypothetical protein